MSFDTHTMNCYKSKQRDFLFAKSAAFLEGLRRILATLLAPGPAKFQ